MSAAGAALDRRTEKQAPGKARGCESAAQHPRGMPCGEQVFAFPAADLAARSVPGHVGARGYVDERSETPRERARRGGRSRGDARAFQRAASSTRRARREVVLPLLVVPFRHVAALVQRAAPPVLVPARGALLQSPQSSHLVASNLR